MKHITQLEELLQNDPHFKKFLKEFKESGLYFNTTSHNIPPEYREKAIMMTIVEAYKAGLEKK